MNTAIKQENGNRSFMDYLPAMYRDDDFTARFLHIFEDIMQPIESIVDKMYFRFDPAITDESFLPWLSTWVGTIMDERWPEERRRQLLASAVELYRWRGTKLGLMEYLRIYTGVVPQITEPSIFSKGGGASVKSQAASAGLEPHQFIVEIEGTVKGTIDPEIVKAIIESQKPAHTIYILKMNA
ncbi:MAG: phage tail protein [Chloroflexi bacterium]|nr:phage tail protein [Chloroflexota bacterium]